jgi:hypothetical protein
MPMTWIFIQNIGGFKKLVLPLVQVAEDMGLKINEDKTKYMVTGNSTVSSPKISVGCYDFQRVESFVYLGTVVNSDGGVMTEIKTRINAANKGYFTLKKHHGSKLLSRKVKCFFYITLIRPVLLYGSETWTVVTGKAVPLQA